MKKSIIVANMEIAELMDLPSRIERRSAINPETGRIMKCLEDVLCYEVHGEYIRYTELKYHRSWNWIMPVVEKIEKVNETTERYGTLIDINTTHIRIGDILADRKRTGESIMYLGITYVDWAEDMTKLDALWACIAKYLE